MGPASILGAPSAERETHRPPPGRAAAALRSPGSRGRQGAQQGGEGQSLARQLGYASLHLASGGRRRVAQSGALDGEDRFLQGLAEGGAGGPHPGPHGRRRRQAGDGVAHKDQLVRRDDDELAVRHEDAGRLVGPCASRERFDGGEQGAIVRLALPRVELQQLAILRGWRRLARGGDGNLRNSWPLGNLHFRCRSPPPPAAEFSPGVFIKEYFNPAGSTGWG